MRDARRLWAQALETYHEPESFRAFLNSCIQALRNVTFVLQKSKVAIPNFDPWYKEWQSALGSDAVSKWLVDARNRIVKEGDLSTRSYARASIVGSYLEAPSFEAEIDPFVPLPYLATALRKKGIPKGQLEDGYVVVERRWVVDNLPEQEVLDALAYSYGVLARLVVGAHGQLIATFAAQTAEGSDIGIHGTPSDLSQSEGRPPCMIDTNEYRAIRLRISSGELVDLQRHPVQIEPEDLHLAQERYDLSSLVGSVGKDDPDRLRVFAKTILEIAKRILLADKALVPFVFLLLPSKQCNLIRLQFDDRTEKYLIWSAVAADVERTGATAIVTVAESWFAPFDESNPLRPAGELPERKELISVDAISEAGEEISMLQFFERTGEQIQLGDLVSEFRGHAYYLDPIRRVWSKKA